MNKETGEAMKNYLASYVDLLVQKFSNREYAIYYCEEDEAEPYKSSGEAIFEHETKSKKNRWYRYYSWNNYTQKFITREVNRDEVRELLTEITKNSRCPLNEYDTEMFKEFGVEI
jgi:hypothetical protein